MAATDIDSPRDSLKAGLRAGLLAMAIAILGAFPSRLLLAMREGDDVVPGLQHIVAGTIVDASAVIASIGGFVVLMAVGLPLLLKALRRPRWPGPRWYGAGPLLVAVLPAFATMVLSMIAQQVHAERGAFPTAFDILESGGNASFIEGVFGFLGYRHILIPTIVTAVCAMALLVAALRGGRNTRRCRQRTCGSSMRDGWRVEWRVWWHRWIACCRTVVRIFLNPVKSSLDPV